MLDHIQRCDQFKRPVLERHVFGLAGPHIVTALLGDCDWFWVVLQPDHCSIPAQVMEHVPRAAADIQDPIVTAGYNSIQHT
jgi:hypothetical protein